MASAATFAALYGIHVRPGFSTSGSVITSFPSLVGIAVAFGLLVGCAEGAVAARAARRAADKFMPLGGFLRKVFVYAAITNVLLSAVVVTVAFSGADLVLAELCSFAVAIVASAFGAALFGWSHSVDWPQIPDFLFTGAPTPRVPSDPRASAEVETTVDLDTGRNEVVHEGRSRRSTSKVDDEVWQEIQDLISGK